MNDASFTAFISEHTVMFGIFMALVTMLIVTEFKRHGRRYNDIRPVEAISLINRNNAVVVDVRPKPMFEKGHVTNAVNIPLDELKSSNAKINKYKNKTLIICCNSGNTSMSACKHLQEQGFESIHNLRGGMVAWERDSYPVIN